MTPELRTKITDKLTKFLNRAPQEHEIINAQTDSILMGWVRDEEIVAQKEKIATQEAEIVILKDKVKI